MVFGLALPKYEHCYLKHIEVTFASFSAIWYAIIDIE